MTRKDVKGVIEPLAEEIVSYSALQCALAH
jgi:hypothetical protein